jgi:hypothetical protein
MIAPMFDIYLATLRTDKSRVDLIYVLSDRRTVPVRELKRPVHKSALVRELVKNIANLFASFQV